MIDGTTTALWKLNGSPKVSGELTVEVTIKIEAIEKNFFGRHIATIAVPNLDAGGFSHACLGEGDSLTLALPIIGTQASRSAITVTEALQVIKEALK